MLAEIHESASRGEDFAFETTLPGKGYLRHIRRWRSNDYHVSLFFLRLPDFETAIARVAARVRQGGHNIPDAVVRRRFIAGLRNLELYKAEVDKWAVYDNERSEPTLMEWSEST